VTAVVTMTDTAPESPARPPLPPGSESFEVWEVSAPRSNDHLENHDGLARVHPRVLVPSCAPVVLGRQRGTGMAIAVPST